MSLKKFFLRSNFTYKIYLYYNLYIRHKCFLRRKQYSQWGEDLIIYPVDGYGNTDMVRSVLRNHKPDLLWFMTDPRFWGWLWSFDNEIRAQVPMVYHHVWDNKPYPFFNKGFYLSNDKIVCISKVTYDIVQTVAPEVDSIYLPHAVDSNIFKPLPKEVFIFLEQSQCTSQTKRKFTLVV